MAELAVRERSAGGTRRVEAAQPASADLAQPLNVWIRYLTWPRRCQFECTDSLIRAQRRATDSMPAARRDRCGAQELQKLTTAVAPMQLADDLAGGQVQRGNQGGRHHGARSRDCDGTRPDKLHSVHRRPGRQWRNQYTAPTKTAPPTILPSVTATRLRANPVAVSAANISGLRWIACQNASGAHA